MENKELATAIYETLKEKGAEIGNASIVIIRDILDKYIEPKKNAPKTAEIDKFIKKFQDEESGSYKQTYDGFNITKNNVELLRKLRRKIKSNFSA